MRFIQKTFNQFRGIPLMGKWKGLLLSIIASILIEPIEAVLRMNLKSTIFAGIMIETRQINDIVNRIALNYNPDKIILFGSYAHGNYSENSDLDFILVKDTNAPKHKRGLEVRRLFYRLTIPMDFKIYTSSEFDKELSNQYSFLSSAIKGSKILYERKN